MSITKICSIKDCESKFLAKGYCNLHYLRYKNHGDPNITNRTGVTGLPEYRIWASMKDRCSNPNSQVYAHYGGRGITVCERWRKSFQAFYEDMGKRPAAQSSLDRIDNEGNYEASNCRWATKTEQSFNRRISPGISGYRGVIKNGFKWTPTISLYREVYTFGSYLTPEEAAYVRYQVELQLYSFML